MAADVSRWAREVVAQRALIVTAVTAIIHAAVVIWALPPTLDATAPVAVGSAIDLVGVLAAVLWARAGVTPAAPAKQPRASDGTALVREGTRVVRPPLGRPHATGHVQRLAADVDRDDPNLSGAWKDHLDGTAQP